MRSGGGSIPDNAVTYIVDRNINYTNVCVADCGFCAFYRRPKHNEGYVLSFEQIGAKIDEARRSAACRSSCRAGTIPYIPFEWYLDLHALHQAQPPDPHPRLLARPKSTSSASASGCGGRRDPRAPCGGPRLHPGRRRRDPRAAVRERVAKKKAQTEEWLEIMEDAHRQGMKTSVTMMYGIGETRRRAHRASLPRARAAGAHRRLHGVHLLAAPAGEHAGDVAHAKTDAVDLSPHAGDRRASCSTTCRTSSRAG